jgi:hypothetical protein
VRTAGPAVTRIRAGGLSSQRCAEMQSHRHCQDAEMQGRLYGRGDRPVDSSRGAAKWSSMSARPLLSLSLSPCPSPSLFLCLTGTRSKSLEREISCEKSSTCRVNSCPFAFAADARSIPSGLVILALSPHEFASGVCGKALGVRWTPFLAYSMPNRVRRTPYCRRSW